MTASLLLAHIVPVCCASMEVGQLASGKNVSPLPDEEIREALKGVEKVAVIDRNISLGNKGIFLTELESALYPLQNRPEVFGFITGLGGLDVKWLNFC